MVFLTEFLTVYGLSLAVYFATAFLMLAWGKARPDLKIQKREARPEEVRRDVTQSLFCMAYISALFAGGWWLNGKLGLGFQVKHPSLWHGALSFLVSMLLYDTWFYWAHRLLHWKPLFVRMHRRHHMSITPTVWSTNHETFLDNLFMQSYWLAAHFLFPIGWAPLLLHKLYDQVTGIIGHSGYEFGGFFLIPPSPLASTTNHDQHHRYFLCNYAIHFTLWDRLMGTLHPTHDSELVTNLKRASVPLGERAPEA